MGSATVARILAEQGQDVAKRIGRSFKAWHYSVEPEELRRLEGGRFGTGTPAADARRLEGEPPEVRSRSFFYLDESRAQPGMQTPRPESTVTGRTRGTYRAQLSRMYDIRENPLGLRGGTEMERDLRELGFNGYFDADAGIAVSLKPETEVVRVGRYRAEAEDVLDRARRLPDQPYNVTAESAPSTTTDFGQWLSEQPLEVKERYTGGVENILEQERFMREIEAERAVRVPGYGGYVDEKGQRVINPNQVIWTPDEETAARVGRARGYVTDQDAVPYFRRAPGESGQLGLRVQLSEGIDPKMLRDAYDATGLDFTRTDIDTLDFINFLDDGGKPLSGVPDEEFAARIERVLGRYEGLRDVERYAAEGDYNWTQDLWNAGGEAGIREAFGSRTGSRLAQIRAKVQEYNRSFRERVGKDDPKAVAILAALTAGIVGTEDAEAGLGSVGLEAARVTGKLLGDAKIGQRISTRYPTGVNRIEDPLTDMLRIDSDAMRASGDAAWRKNMDLLARYPQLTTPLESPDKRAEFFKDVLTENLLDLYERIPPEVAAQARDWYRGANRIASGLSARYKISMESAAGVIAALSPRKRWDMNVSLAERLIDIYSNPGTLSSEAAKVARRIFSGDAYADDLKILLNRPWEDLSRRQKAMYIRAKDQAENPRGFRLIAPSGELGDFATSKSGKEATTDWASLVAIEKAIAVLDDPSMDNISAAMGKMHKVRNFYNNIVDPESVLGDVTIDTHAIAADLWSPVGTTAPQVLHNFGSAGVASSAITGAMGTYGLHADAYRRAAEIAGMLPREMQSITWEGIRQLFPAAAKKGLLPKVDAVWENYRRGAITLREARDEIFDIAGGIQPPDWLRHSGGNATGPQYSTYKGELPASSVSGSVADGMDRGAGVDAARGIAGLTPAAALGAVLFGVLSPEEAEAAEMGGMELDPAIDEAVERRMAVNAFLRRYNDRKAQYDQSRDVLLRSAARASEAVLRLAEMATTGYLGMARVAGGLVAGEGMDQALAAGARYARQPIEQTAYELGGVTTDVTGSPLAGTAVYTAVNLGGL